MRVDFSLLSQPMQKSGGQVGHGGQSLSMRVSDVPHLSPVTSELGDKLDAGNVVPRESSPVSPNCLPTQGTRNPNDYAAVPHVPRVPPENEQVCTEQATVQVWRWMAARCTRTMRTWGAEKFLYRDYLGRCQQSSQPAISAEHFVAIL